MKTRCWIVPTLALLFAAAGCNSSAPVPPATPPNSPAAPTAAAQPASPAIDTATSKATAGPSAAPGPAATPPVADNADLRSLAARLVERSGDAWRINEQAATDLEKLGPDARGPLLSLLTDRQVEVRRGAAFYLLGGLNPNDAAQVAAFSSLLDDPDQTIRGIGLSAVKQMQSEDQEAAVPRLAAMLDSSRENKSENRATAARLLAGLKSQAAPALEHVTAAAAGDPDKQVRSACLVALAQIAAADEAAVLLVKGLADKEASVRLVAAARLRQLGAASAPAAKELAAALADSDSGVRAAAAEALIRIGTLPDRMSIKLRNDGKSEAVVERPGKRAVDALVAQLGSSSLDARKLALACLAKIGPSAKDAAAAIEKCLTDSDPDVQKLAKAALAQIKP